MEKLQLSSMYGKFGDESRTRLGIIADSGKADLLREIQNQSLSRHIKEDVELTLEIPEEDMMERIMKDCVEDGVKIIPVDSIPQGSGKTSMSLKQIAVQTGVPEDRIRIINEASMIPDDLEGFKPGEIVIIDSMRALDRKSGIDIDTMRRLAMELDAQEPVQLRLSRTEKRKQQRAKVAEERKLRKQLAKEAKKQTTIYQTILEADQLTKNNTVYHNNDLRGVGSGIYYDEQWEE